MKNLLFVILASFIFVLSSCEKVEIPLENQDDLSLKSGKKVLNFRTHLSGENEVPSNSSMATGQVIFQLSKDSMELSYKLIVDEIENVTASHIHLAPKGTNGGVVVALYPTSAPPVSGSVEGILAEGIITAANLKGALIGQQLSSLIEAIYAGNAYVNVHTAQFPGGEIRGQIEGNMPGKNE